jgi:endothelin-converting enzyme
MAIDAIKQVGIAPLQDLLSQLTKIIAVEDSAFGTGAQLQAQDSKAVSDAILFLEELGISHFVSLGVGSDDKNPVWCGHDTRASVAI